jgi:hypothetical protein
MTAAMWMFLRCSNPVKTLSKSKHMALARIPAILKVDGDVVYEGPATSGYTCRIGLDHIDTGQLVVREVILPTK